MPEEAPRSCGTQIPSSVKALILDEDQLIPSCNSMKAMMLAFRQRIRVDCSWYLLEEPSDAERAIKA
jgi:hypothetical protein